MPSGTVAQAGCCCGSKTAAMKPVVLAIMLWSLALASISHGVSPRALVAHASLQLPAPKVKERSSRHCLDRSRRGKKLTTDRVVARGKIAMAQRGVRTRGSGPVLRARQRVFTLTPGPRRILQSLTLFSFVAMTMMTTCFCHLRIESNECVSVCRRFSPARTPKPRGSAHPITLSNRPLPDPRACNPPADGSAKGPPRACTPRDISTHGGKSERPRQARAPPPRTHYVTAA